MIVIMRDAVMPECCKTCICSEGYGCGITGTEMTTKEMESRPDWCPLEEAEPCRDTVSRAAAIDAFWKLNVEMRPTAIDEVVKMLRELPSTQPEWKKGTWCDVGSLSCRCSECGCKSPKEYSYCPNCGADMKGEQE